MPFYARLAVFLPRFWLRLILVSGTNENRCWLIFACVGFKWVFHQALDLNILLLWICPVVNWKDWKVLDLLYFSFWKTVSCLFLGSFPSVSPCSIIFLWYSKHFAWARRRSWHAYLLFIILGWTTLIGSKPCSFCSVICNGSPVSDLDYTGVFCVFGSYSKLWVFHY